MKTDEWAWWMEMAERFGSEAHFKLLQDIRFPESQPVGAGYARLAFHFARLALNEASE